MHVALLNANEPLFTRPLGDDLTVLRQLGERVDRLTVVVNTARHYDTTDVAANVRVVAACASNRLHGLGVMARTLDAVHRHHPVDLVQAQECMYTGLLALPSTRRMRAKLTVCVFGTDPFDTGFRSASVEHRAAALAGRRVIRRADVVQTDSRHTQAELSRRGVVARYKAMTPANLPELLAHYNRREHRTNGRDVLFVGRLGPQKRVGLLLDAAARVPGLRLRIVGDGPDRPRLERQAAALDLDVRFVGQVDHAALAEAYLNSDVLALSSHYEGMPRAFMEAAATGLPIVSTAVAGALELQEAWIAPTDPAGYAKALRSALEAGEERRHRGAKLHARIAERRNEPAPPDQQAAIWKDAVG